jgi:hypothetical protein
MSVPTLFLRALSWPDKLRIFQPVPQVEPRIYMNLDLGSPKGYLTRALFDRSDRNQHVSSLYSERLSSMEKSAKVSRVPSPKKGGSNTLHFRDMSTFTPKSDVSALSSLCCLSRHISFPRSFYSSNRIHLAYKHSRSPLHLTMNTDPTEISPFAAAVHPGAPVHAPLSLLLCLLISPVGLLTRSRPRRSRELAAVDAAGVVFPWPLQSCPLS